jgi:hypothetical protein
MQVLLHHENDSAYLLSQSNGTSVVARPIRMLKRRGNRKPRRGCLQPLRRGSMELVGLTQYLAVHQAHCGHIPGAITSDIECSRLGMCEHGGGVPFRVTREYETTLFVPILRKQQSERKPTPALRSWVIGRTAYTNRFS